MCPKCGPYPVLSGVPVLVPDPAAWCGRFYDSILAAMAEDGEVEHAEVVTVQTFAERGGKQGEQFGDDWTAHERSGDEAPIPSSPSAAKILKGLTRQPSPQSWIRERIGTPALTVELGCGAGQLSPLLADASEALIVADLSLRAVFAAREAADGALGVVVDAHALPFASKSVDLLVAENVVDLLEEPSDFLEETKRVLKGRALLTTPDPELGTDDPEALRGLLEDAGLKITEHVDGLTWLRLNDARFVELYFASAFALTASPARGR